MTGDLSKIWNFENNNKSMTNFIGQVWKQRPGYAEREREREPINTWWPDPT